MADFTSKIESHVHRLRAAIASGNQVNIDAEVQDIEAILLDNQAYRAIGDERLLAEMMGMLADRYGPESGHYLDGLREHLAKLHIIHDKLYAILNASIDLDTLLLDHLSRWFSDSIELSVSDEVKNKLHEARISGDGEIYISEYRLQTCLNVYFSYLRDQNRREIADAIEPLVKLALDGYRRLRTWKIYCLFATGDRGDVYGVNIQVLTNGNGQISAVHSAGEEMKNAASSAVGYVKQLYPQTRQWDFLWDIGRDDIPFDGNSIGLGLVLGIIAHIENLDIDAYTAFTGRIDWLTGNVARIEHLDLKLQAAKEMGIRRVFIPKDNEDYEHIEGVEIVSVESVVQAKQILLEKAYIRASTDLERRAEIKIQELSIELKGQNIKKTAESHQPNSCIRLEFSDFHDTAIVNVYHAQQLRCWPQGKDSVLMQKVKAACDKVFGAKPSDTATLQTAKPDTKKYTVREGSVQQRIEQHLTLRGDSIRESENNCIYRMKITKGSQLVYVRQFAKGTLTIFGISPLLDEVDSEVRAILGITNDQAIDNNDHQSRLDTQIEAVRAVELGERWIGTDESGKGDYFGPLVGAAVLVDTQIAKLLEQIGVKDSKTLSDKRNQELADEIRRVCGKRAQVVTITPEKYNSLYEQFKSEGKNLNMLLAWAHTRALEDILSEFPQQQITVLVDKFGDEHFVQSKLLSKGRQTDLNLVQLPKAEANVAVAAASILARAQFLQSLARLSDQYRVDLPKGSSDPRIIEIGRQIVDQHGKDELRRLAKMHFVTTQKILNAN